MPVNLDDWLPEPQVRTRQRRESSADPRLLWRAAEAVRIRDAPILGMAVRWRIPGTAPELPFRELLRSYPFTVLEEGERCSVSGLCGRIWTLQRDYPRIHGPEEFRAWSEPGTVRVAIANWVEADAAGGAVLVSESRIKPVDARASARLRFLWTLVGRFERFVGREALVAAVRRAERG
jgi:hypothetical protein